jgi:uncharacterized protein YgiB involved in biofilm formation
MRRSRSIRLVLLGATVVTLGACGDEDLAQGEYYPDEATCQRAGVSDCAQAYAEARERHVATAPQFADLAACESEYGTGNCEMAPTTPQAASPPPPPDTAVPSWVLNQQRMFGSGGSGGTSYGGVHYFPVMHGFTYYRGAPAGSMGMPIYTDRTGSAFSGRTRIGSFSSGGSFQGMRSRRGGFGSFFRSSRS